MVYICVSVCNTFVRKCVCVSVCLYVSVCVRIYVCVRRACLHVFVAGAVLNKTKEMNKEGKKGDLIRESGEEGGGGREGGGGGGGGGRGLKPGRVSTETITLDKSEGESGSDGKRMAHQSAY